MQQRLQERASMLRLYVHCLSSFLLGLIFTANSHTQTTTTLLPLDDAENCTRHEFP